MKLSTWKLSPIIIASALFGLGADDTGCQSQSSDSVDQDRIYASYWLLYDVESDATYARAQFRFGSAVGTTLILDGDAQVDYNGRNMGFNELLDWHEVVLPGRVENGTFTYRNADGEQFENRAPDLREAHVPASFPAALPSDAGFDFAWDGTALADDELMEVILANDANRFDFVRIDQRNQGATSVLIPSNSLATLARDTSVIGLRRHSDYTLEQATSAGGKMTTTFQSDVARFDLQ